jgi:hypothetical protein
MNFVLQLPGSDGGVTLRAAIRDVRADTNGMPLMDPIFQVMASWISSPDADRHSPIQPFMAFVSDLLFRTPRGGHIPKALGYRMANAVMFSMLAALQAWFHDKEKPAPSHVGEAPHGAGAPIPEVMLRALPSSCFEGGGRWSFGVKGTAANFVSLLGNVSRTSDGLKPID